MTGLQVTNDKITAVGTTRGPIATETVVSCAGPQTAHIGRMAGVEIPVAPARVEIIATVPLPPLFDVYVSGHGLYGRQTRRGNLIFGGGPHEWTDVEPTQEPGKPNTPLIRNIARRLAELMPAVADQPVLRSWAGVVEQAGAWKVERAAWEAAQRARLFIVLGSSLAVAPANLLPEAAADAGAPLVIVNRDPTPLDRMATLVINASIGETLRAVDQLLSS